MTLSVGDFVQGPSMTIYEVINIDRSKEHPYHLQARIAFKGNYGDFWSACKENFGWVKLYSASES